MLNILKILIFLIVGKVWLISASCRCNPTDFLHGIIAESPRKKRCSRCRSLHVAAPPQKNRESETVGSYREMYVNRGKTDIAWWNIVSIWQSTKGLSWFVLMFMHGLSKLVRLSFELSRSTKASRSKDRTESLLVSKDVALLTRSWFQTLFIFTPTWKNDPSWLIFLKWVDTTTWLSVFCFIFHKSVCVTIVMFYCISSCFWDFVNLPYCFDWTYWQKFKISFCLVYLFLTGRLCREIRWL